MAGLSGYNAFLRAVRAATGISHREAQQAYRGTKERLGRAPAAADVSKHPKIAREEARKAGPAIERAARARTREIDRALAKAAKERAAAAQRRTERGAKRRGGGILPPAPAPQPGGAEGPGGGYAGGPEGQISYDGYEDNVWYDIEDPLEES